MHYRPEIDGLRAVAVIPVILFHAGFELFSGGYAGVDVFFVISGYLITSIICGELDQDTFSIRRFYERRIRRILPALFFVMLCCIPMAWLWMSPSQLKNFSEATIAVSTFTSNILFWWKSDYFAPDARLDPLLHTWSLAVEEQFYILFPLIVLAIWRFGKNIAFLTISILVVCSLFLSEQISTQFPSANFYLLPSRAWELGIGALCAFVLHRRVQPRNGFVAGIGSVMILLSFVLYDESVLFPSLYALLPVGGAALFIIFAASGTPAARLLSTPLFVGLGLVSYSAYLWHQPIFAFARILNLSEPTGGIMAMLALLSLVLAVLTWRFIESPFRRKHAHFLGRSERVFAAALIASIGFIAVGSYGAILDGNSVAWTSPNEAVANAISFLDYKDSPEYSAQFKSDNCGFSGNTGSFRDFDKSCLTPSLFKKNFLLIGDSHAVHLTMAFAKFYAEHNILRATASGCRPILHGGGAPACRELYDYIFDWLGSHPTAVEGVILSARWRKGKELDGLKETLAFLRGLGLKTVVLGPIVEYDQDLPLLIAYSIKLGEKDFDASRYVRQEVWEIDHLVAEVARRSESGYLSMVDAICDGNICRLYSKGGDPIQFDYGHLTGAGAMSIIEENFPPEINDLFRTNHR